MGFSLDVSVPVITVFLQGVLSFFSPCVLPLLPLYVGYLSGGTARRGEDGRLYYDRRRVMMNTLFFVIGVGAAFFILGLGVSALGTFSGTARCCLCGWAACSSFSLDCTSLEYVARLLFWGGRGGFPLSWIPWPCRRLRPFFWALPSASRGRPVWGPPWPAF